MTDKNYIRGVGGWLGLLIVALCILGPLSGIGRTAGDIEAAEKATPALLNMAQWADYKQYTWWTFIFSATLSFIAGYRLWKFHHPESVRFAIIVLWTMNFINIIGQYVIVKSTFGQQAVDAAASELVTATFSAIVVATVWTLYLVLSRRVKNTYYTQSQAFAVAP